MYIRHNIAAHFGCKGYCTPQHKVHHHKSGFSGGFQFLGPGRATVPGLEVH